MTPELHAVVRMFAILGVLLAMGGVAAWMAWASR